MRIISIQECAIAHDKEFTTRYIEDNFNKYHIGDTLLQPDTGNTLWIVVDVL